MLCRTLHHFDIHLYMANPSIAPPRDRDQVLMEIFHSQGLSRETMQCLSRCRVSIESIFLSDLTTVDGRYLEYFVFNPGGRNRSSSFRFPRKIPTREDWNRWFDFWHIFTTTGNKLKVPLGNWINPTYRIWKWYFRVASDDLLLYSTTSRQPASVSLGRHGLITCHTRNPFSQKWTTCSLS